MSQQTLQKAMGDSMNKVKNDLLDIPIACQYGNLCSNDTHRIHNENANWLTERKDKLPIWSRLKPINCAGQSRQMMYSKDKDYEIEIPGRLLSIFGTISQQTSLNNKMKNMENYQLVGNILALCAALSCNFLNWSINLLDKIMTKATQLYPELLRRLNITDKEFNYSHLNQFYQFENTDYQVQVQQVATGYLYIRYGLNEFNLARALTWFFRNYQFGLLKCCNRTLAFGFTFDTNYGFFMFDCHSREFPLFENQQTTSYILRTHHLQILLYCLIMTLNISTEMMKFYIYNVDIRILNSLETKSLRKEIYVPTIVTKKEVEKKVDCGTIHKRSNNKAIPNTPCKTAKTFTTTTALKASTSLAPKLPKKSNPDTKTKPLKSETLKSENSQKKIPLDPNKTYYIIAVPKESNIIIAKSTSKLNCSSQKDINAKTEKSVEKTDQNVKVNLHRINTLKPSEADEQTDTQLFQESESETIYLDKTASSSTLTPDPTEGNYSNPLGLKLYLVDNRNNCK
ncbi:uncharacterized protein LOC111686376 [Lucilia cuprina]|uniref:uncharacterized protein LOC111686376 n=1 Tax=Lucilia cuprina TaxID=7375 RepID=UPI001F065137|nr:uncharacterized protein LOC111686376 [Lucilia cuprina]